MGVGLSFIGFDRCFDLVREVGVVKVCVENEGYVVLEFEEGCRVSHYDGLLDWTEICDAL